MTARLAESDLGILKCIAEYRILTVEQLSLLAQRNAVGVHRRLSQLQRAGLILATVRQHGRKRGRPEKLISLSAAGAGILIERAPASGIVSPDAATAEGIHCIDHQLLCNWFRVHLAHIPRIAPQLEVGFFAPTSPFPPAQGADGALVGAQLSCPGVEGAASGFVPDGICWLRHGAQDKTILLFLEVDRGTEPLASPQRHKGDVRQKVVNYQAFFRSGGQQRFEKLWNCRLRGFRVLLLASSPQRLSALCALVRQMPPSDFIWLSGQQELFQEGLWNRIWVCGGRPDGGLKSILGSQLPQPCPTPPWRA